MIGRLIWVGFFFLGWIATPFCTIVMDLAGWPTVFELDCGETISLQRNGKSWQIELVDVAHQFQPDYRSANNADQKVFSQAQVVLRIDGELRVLKFRPYQMPQEHDGLRLYVEMTKSWGEHGDLATMTDLQKEVRLSAVCEGEPWGPEMVRFPIARYRWRSSLYANTWAALVPTKDTIYYHKGEDYGVMPDRLDVLSFFDGTVFKTPLPKGDGESNGLCIRNENGLWIRYAHMNLETIRPHLLDSASVSSGDILGKTGCTWQGTKSQHSDPHLHFDLNYKETHLSPYPYLVEAYLRDYPDNALPVAGGYIFGSPGELLELNASRSIARPGRKIVSYQWVLHKGGVRKVQVLPQEYTKPGFYAEELQIRLDDGSEYRDIAQVRI
ncbi:MAG: peptidoglycan DD-metalloendopeptidase family protein, partial [bacterium]|nr:peptidoglycan DD-metalloendopeptidase family protein [bacterium]